MGKTSSCKRNRRRSLEIKNIATWMTPKVNFSDRKGIVNSSL